MAASREALWGIINNCLDISALDYCTVCKVTRTESSCKEKVSCEAQLELWAESSNYIAMKDRKMCGCSEEFVHGLTLPRAQVTGVEDPKRPSGIWDFAWNVARKRINGENTIALVVNPAQHRSQDQLHVHMVRLKEDARKIFSKLATARTDSLDRVWIVAQEKATELKLDDYGVLVATHTDGGFVILVDRESPEYKFTEATCR
jgi:CDP-diacylglycerol pyrophosphatase